MSFDSKVYLERIVPFEQAGEWASAIEACQAAFRESLSGRDPDGVTEATLRSGFCYRQMGDRELAEDQLHLALLIAELRGDRIRSGRALNGIAAIHHSYGELILAEQFYRRAQTAVEDPHSLLAANINQNLGALYVLRGDREAATAHFELALAGYAATKDQRGAAQVLNNLGSLAISQGDRVAAARYLDDALASSRRIGDPLTEATVQINRTEMFVLSGELESARASCDDAFEIFSALDETAGRSEALKCYGIIYRTSGRLYLAESHLLKAIELATSHDFVIEAAEAHRELALVFRAQGRNKEALSALKKSHQLLSDAQATGYQAETKNRIGQIEEDFLSIVQQWGESIEAKDRYTVGHCKRVESYATALAEQTGIDAQDLLWFRMGAFLHDLGKTQIPEEILNKNGALSEDERLLMEQHTLYGCDMLSNVEFPWDVLPMIRSHHERWDGRGYPDGLIGDKIPLTARILRVADVFDALTSTRSYRLPLSAQGALKVMEEDAGSFDPDLLTKFRHLVLDSALSATFGD